MGKSSEFRNFIWNLIGTTVNAFMSLVYQVIVTRVNGLEATGVFSVCFSFSLIVYTFSNLGGRVFEVADLKGDDSTYYTLKWFTGGISMAFSLAFSWLCGYEREKTMLIMLLMLVRIVESFSDTVYAVWQKAERLDLVGISYILKNIISVATFTILNVITGSMMVATGTMLIATVAVYFSFDLRILKGFCHIQWNTSMRACAILARQLLYFIGYNIVIMVIANLPKLIADQKYTDSQVGYFGILMMIPTVMLLMGQLLIQQNLTKITKQYHIGNFSTVKRIIGRMFIRIALLATICCVGAYLLGVPVLNLIYGLDFCAYKNMMILLIIAGMFNVFATILSVVLTVMEKTNQQLQLYLVVMVLEALSMSFGLSGESEWRIFLIYAFVMLVQFCIFQLYFNITMRGLYGKLG